MTAQAQDLGVPVYTRVEAHANSPADGLGHLALVDGAQPGIGRVLDAAHGGHKLGDEGEVLPVRPVCQYYSRRLHQITRKKGGGNKPCSYPMG